MCYKFECSKCGKYTWGGCGKHLENLYASIDEGKHCMCNSWPGVVTPSKAAASSTDQQPSSQSETSAQGNEESSLSKQP